uniref:AB hydrolase-1 domain-containing protein n=1 Tax=Lotharella oceanica TaxID=641309 RepID=A0A7S2TTF4_9EUKA
MTATSATARWAPAPASLSMSRRRSSTVMVGSSALEAPPAVTTNIHDEQLKASGIGTGERKTFRCDVDGRPLKITYDVFAGGDDASSSKAAAPTLFLATPSFVPSRATFADLANAMGSSSPAILTELPGYGLNDGTLTELDAYQPSLFRGFLKKFFAHLQGEFGTGINVVSAGHAAFYALDAVKESPSDVRAMFLINPTYRGPLTTIKMKQKDNAVVPALVDALCGGIAAAYQLPAPLGTAVHASQCSEASIKRAMLSHVYEDPTNVTPQAIEINRQFAAQGERWGKCAFLVGRTDPYPVREDAAAAHGSGTAVPTAVCVGAKEEEIFKKDLSFLTDQGVPMIVTPGAQRNFVEYPEQVAKAALEFFSKQQ